MYICIYLYDYIYINKCTYISNNKNMYYII